MSNSRLTRDLLTTNSRYGIDTVCNRGGYSQVNRGVCLPLFTGEHPPLFTGDTQRRTIKKADFRKGERIKQNSLEGWRLPKNAIADVFSHSICCILKR